MSAQTDLAALHEAWKQAIQKPNLTATHEAWDEFTGALVNAYSEGRLSESPAVGGERMSEERLAIIVDGVREYRWADDGCRVPIPAREVLDALRAERAYATSLERKPLDGYDWRADLRVVDGYSFGIKGTPSSPEADRLAAYIEALEARNE